MGFVTRTIVLDRAGRVAFDGPAAEIIRTHAPDLMAMGWLPGATLAALRMQDAGAHFDELPLTPSELAAALTVTRVNHLQGPGATSSAASRPNRLQDRGTGAGPDDAVSPDVRATVLQTDAGRGSTTETGDTAPIISARGLTVRRHRTEILHGIDLDLSLIHI